MSNKKQTVQPARRFAITVRVFFRKFPTIFYILKWTLISSLIGICAGTASAFFLWSLDKVTNFRETHVWIIALLPVSGFAIGMLYQYIGKDVEQGNNLLINAIHKPGPTIPFRMAPLVYLGTVVTHLFGGSAGREGTAMQMSGAITDQFSKILGLAESERRVLIMAAIAAGFGSVFGTPLAGAFFALEIIVVGRTRYDALFPAVLAAVIANLVTSLWNIQHTQYHIPLVPAITMINLFYAIIAGIAFGICAATFSKGLHLLTTAFKRTITYAPFRPLVGGAIVATAVFIIGTTKYIGLGIPVIVQSLDQQLPAYDFGVKLLFTIVTLAAGFKGGEVTPLFFIGALLGNALSYFLPLPVGLLAGMGFVAVFAGATNTPMACSIMAVEMFGSACGIYVFVACVVSYLMSGHNSIYRSQMIGEPKHNRFEHDAGKRFTDV